MKKNKIFIVLSALFLVVAIFAIVSKINSSNENKKNINGYDTEISTVYTKFMADKEDSDKLNS